MLKPNFLSKRHTGMGTYPEGMNRKDPACSSLAQCKAEERNRLIEFLEHVEGDFRYIWLFEVKNEPLANHLIVNLITVSTVSLIFILQQITKDALN